VTWSIELTAAARRLLAEIRDRRVREGLGKRIEKLSRDPDQQGKPLLGELAGLRSVRAVGQRYRILYRLKHRRVVVLVVAVGLRKEGSKRDVYKVAKKLLRLRLLDPDEDEE
jgi:mRNA interferase RelE/StbE